MNNFAGVANLNELSRASVRLLVERERMLHLSDISKNERRRQNGEIRKAKRDLAKQEDHLKRMERSFVKFLMECNMECPCETEGRCNGNSVCKKLKLKIAERKKLLIEEQVQEIAEPVLRENVAGVNQARNMMIPKV